jgi:hypothetical protein
MEKADSCHHGVSLSSHQAQLDLLLAALKSLVDDGLTAGCVLANLHHRRIIPLMKRPPHLRDARGRGPRRASAVAVDAGPLPSGVCGIDLRAARSDDAALWAFTMLPVRPLVSGLPPPLVLPVRGISACFEALLFFADNGRERRAVRPAHAPSPSACARGAAAGARAGGAQEGAEHPATGAPRSEE